jgi:hypothetical protein
MSESRKPEVEAVRRRQRGKRVKRGLVASYIHELSERHAPAASIQPMPREPLPEPSRSA